jgi:hypothetical protein
MLLLPMLPMLLLLLLLLPPSLAVNINTTRDTTTSTDAAPGRARLTQLGTQCSARIVQMLLLLLLRQVRAIALLLLRGQHARANGERFTSHPAAASSTDCA